MLDVTVQPAESPSTRSASSVRFRLEILTTFAEAERIRDAWDELAKRVDADLFATFDWCATWWKHFSEDRLLRIHAFWAGDDLVGLFPLFRETISWGPLRLRVVRVLGTDHAGTRCWPLFESSRVDEMVRTLLSELGRERAWDVFQIGDLPGYYPGTQALGEALQMSGDGRTFRNLNYYPHAVFPIPPDFETYLERLSGNERNNIRKNERRLSKTHDLSCSIVPREKCDSYLREFFQWHDEYWNAQNELGFFSLWPGARQFHADFAHLSRRGSESVFLRVVANENPVGSVYAYRFCNRLHLFQAVRAPRPEWDSYGAGRLLHCETFRWCMTRGVTAVDGMSGFYEYKRRLGAEFLGLATLAVVHPSFSSRIRVRLVRTLILAINALYFRLWLSRVVPFLRSRKGLHDRSWLRAGMARRFIRSRFLMAALRDSATDQVVEATEQGDG